MKKIFLLFIVAVASITANAQDKKLPQFKAVVEATASEYPLNSATLYSPTVAGEVLGTIGSVGNVRFSAGGIYKRNFTTTVNTYHGVGQVSYHASIFEPFARFSAGIDTIPQIGIQGSSRQFSREFSFGADINAGRVTFRAIRIGFKRVGAVSFLQGQAERTLSVGLGFNF